MRYPPEHKQQSKSRILKAGRAVFANVGFDRATINSIMDEAGMTRGGFYKHFESKTELLIAVVKDGHVTVPDTVDCKVSDILARYVGQEHLDNKGEACPLFTFPTDVSRHNSEVKQAYEDVAASIAAVLSVAMPDDDEDTAMAMMAMCVGCMVVINSSESAAFKDRLREATLNQIRKMAD